MGTAGTQTTESAAAFRDPNPTITVEARPHDRQQRASMLRGVDLVIDCYDSYTTRSDISTAAVALGVPVVYGSGIWWDGVVTVLNSRGGPCSCYLFPSPDLSHLRPP